VTGSGACNTGPMRISSPAFPHESAIPVRYTVDGESMSPPLRWEDPPAETQSLALVVEDPDDLAAAAHHPAWVHWVVYNIPPTALSLDEDASGGELPGHTQEGKNDWGRVGYEGPAPTVGTHRYVFNLYALDAVLPAPAHLTRDALDQAMRGHVLDRATFVGTFWR